MFGNLCYLTDLTSIYLIDIKPDNLLLSKDNVLKIVDFGVSEIFTTGNDKMKKSAGSPAFMAPVSLKQLVIILQYPGINPQIPDSHHPGIMCW